MPCPYRPGHQAAIESLQRRRLYGVAGQETFGRLCGISLLVSRSMMPAADALLESLALVN